MEGSVYVETLSKDLFNVVLKKHEMDSKTVERDIDTILEWFETRPHLPRKFGRRVIFSYLLVSKGSVESAKQKIDSYFTVRSKFKDIFGHSNPKDEKMLTFEKNVCCVPLPKINKDLARVMILKVQARCDVFDPVAAFGYIYNVVDLRLREDFCKGDHLIYDTTHIKPQHLANCSPLFIKRMVEIVEKTLKMSVNGLHIVNAPAFVVNFFNMVKPFLKPKVGNRIVFHKTLESLYDYIDRDILPVEYGGNEVSLDELQKKLHKAFDHYQDYYDDRDLWEVNEELRPEKIINDDFYGYQGNFKKLDVD